MKKFTLKKEERLKSRKLIEEIFGKKVLSINEYPLRVVWIEAELKTNYPAQAGFSVSKKNFRKAIDRNRIKRLMREAYRLNKFILYDVLIEKKKQLALMLLYTERTIPTQKLVSEKIIVILNRLKEKLETN